MTAFRDLAPSENAPAKVVPVPRSAFADTYDEKPVDDAQMGLRLLSEADLEDIRVRALEHAQRHGDDYDSRVEALNDCLVRLAVARGTTNPADVRERYFGVIADDQVGYALTPEGTLLVYEHLVIFWAEQSPLMREATDEDIAALPAKLAAAPANVRARLRRAIGYAVGALGEGM